MIRVTVELLPGGVEDHPRRRILGVAELSNDLQQTLDSDGDRGSYDVTLSKFGGLTAGVWKRGRVGRFDRVARGPWDLLYLALHDTAARSRPAEATFQRPGARGCYISWPPLTAHTWPVM